jgi:hypothetical protein
MVILLFRLLLFHQQRRAVLVLVLAPVGVAGVVDR